MIMINPVRHTAVLLRISQSKPEYLKYFLHENILSLFRLNIDTPILTDLTATTTSVRHDENVSIQVPYKNNLDLLLYDYSYFRMKMNMIFKFKMKILT